MFILKKGHQPGVYVPLRAHFLVTNVNMQRVLWFLYLLIYLYFLTPLILSELKA